MDDRNYDNYKYTSSGRSADSRRTDTGRNRRYGDEFDFDDDFDMRSSQKTSRNSADSRKGTASRRREEDDPEFYYDARGVRVKKSRFSKEFLQTLFFFVIPYIVVNTIVFLIVTSTPKITIDPKSEIYFNRYGATVPLIKWPSAGFASEAATSADLPSGAYFQNALGSRYTAGTPFGLSVDVAPSPGTTLRLK